ncbi:MAG: hypothetical protein H6747_04575 [Deltaproteobacteria bacterium]|nr:hypothetical protein [Deltaproteobacteria bacterium]
MLILYTLRVAERTKHTHPEAVFRWLIAAALILAGGCGEGAVAAADGAASDASADSAATVGDPCRDPGTDGATATCSKPTKEPAYYVEQANRYFDTLDIDADPESVPNYAPQVARWEWPPWLLLTGFSKATMIQTSKLLKQGDPSTVPVRDCRFFPVQPFARCRVSFSYAGGPCPIYEEFVFNDAGEMTFIEAWSDLPGLVPTAADDPWGERTDIGRLSTRVPGLGKPDGAIDLLGAAMQATAANDPDVAEFAKRAGDQWKYWGEELANAPKDFFAKGCGW